MVRRIAFFSIMLLFSISLFADVTIKGGVELDGGYGYINKDSYGQFYKGDAYLSAGYSASGFRAEIKGRYNIGYLGDKIYAYSSWFDIPVSQTVTLERAYARFRLPSFNDKKLTIVSGYAPLSWGLGSYYRAGDVLFSTPVTNEKAGETTEKTLWVLSLSQPLGAGITLDVAFAPPLFSSDGSREKLGAMLRSSFDNDYIKELRVAYAYDWSDVHKASITLDMNLYFDIVTGVESKFRSGKDIRLVLNLMKQYSIDTETKSYPVSLYVSSQFDFYKSAYDFMETASVGITDRTELSCVNINQFLNGKYSATVALTSSSKLLDGVTLEAGIGLMYVSSGYQKEIGLLSSS